METFVLVNTISIKWVLTFVVKFLQGLDNLISWILKIGKKSATQPKYSRFYSQQYFTILKLNLTCKNFAPNSLLLLMLQLNVLKPPWRMGAHRAAQKMDLFYYRGSVNYNFKVPSSSKKVHFPSSSILLLAPSN